MHFAPLPDGLGRPTRPLMDRPALSGDEVVVGLGAVCDLERVPRVGDPSVRFDIAEFVELDDGRPVLLRDLGFTLSSIRYTDGRAPEEDPTAGLSLEDVIDEVRATTGPEVRADGTVSDEEHGWDELALFVRDIGLTVTADRLKAVGYAITVTDRLRELLSRRDD
ncbi:MULTISPECIES: hypothetical protein [Actinomycetes]